jgi:hypothetical protein
VVQITSTVNVPPDTVQQASLIAVTWTRNLFYVKVCTSLIRMTVFTFHIGFFFLYWILSQFFLRSSVCSVLLLSLILWHDAWTPEVCSQRSTAETSIARQRFGKHISEVTLSTVEGQPLLGSKLLGTFPWQRIGTQWQRNIRSGDLYSVLLNFIIQSRTHYY